MDDNAHDVDHPDGDNDINISVPASYLSIARCSPPPSDPSPSHGAQQAPLTEVQGHRTVTVIATNTSLGRPVVVCWSSSLACRTMGGRPGRRPPPRRLRHTTLNIRKRWLHAASPSTCASARGRKSLAAFPSSSVLKARRVVASPCTYASSHGCLIPSCTNPAAVAFPHRTPKAGVKSFTIRFREPRGCALRHLSRTLLRGAAFRRSSTDVNSIVRPTVTAKPPARVPHSVYAASTFNTLQGTASIRASHRPTAMLSGLLAPCSARCATTVRSTTVRSSPWPCLIAPTWRHPRRGRM
jgi:hypothetical protein